MTNRWHNAFIFMLASIGGFAIMTVELLGGRILAPYFGNSIHIWGSIITVFMLSLAVGYLLGGRLSLHKANLGRFGLLFIFGGLTLLPINFAAEPLMNAIFDNIEDSRYGSLIASIALFTLPTILLGMISPYAIRLLVTNTESSGHTAGILYFVSTLGSGVGTIMTSFYLVLWFEVQQIIYGIVLGLLLLGLLCYSYSKFALKNAMERETR